MKKLLIILVVLTISACNTGRFQDGYQLGDATLTVLDKYHAYCALPDSLGKTLALNDLHARYPLYPEDGVCAFEILEIE